MTPFDPETATVDDFLALFREHRDWRRWYFQDVSAYGGDFGKPEGTCSVSFVLENRYDRHFDGPTLLEACRLAWAEVTK